MSKFQLRYLNLRAKGEPIRLFFNYVQQPFEDIQENFLDFAKYKDKIPSTRIPKLVVDETYELCYTNIILEYLGKKFGIEAETNEEKSTCACLGERFQEYMYFLKPYINCLLGLVPAEKLALLYDEVFYPCITKDYGPVFENQLQKCNTGYLVGNSLTWIDFYAASFSDFALTYGRNDVFEKFPRIQYHKHAIFSLPQLQNYLKIRVESLC